MKILRVPEKDLDDITIDDLGGIRKDKTICIVRYGAFGDILIASSVFPIFKEMGYKVCVNVSERGLDILRHDPNVDEIIVQKTDQIPNTRLTEYWEIMSQGFDKLVQLSESIEQTLLLMPSHTVKMDGKDFRVPANPNYEKDKDFIHNMCDVNYLERTHELCGVENKFTPKFFPTGSEKRFAKNFKRNLKTRYLVMWVLSGSSVHKVYPWTDPVIVKLLSEREDVTVLTVGDEICQMLEIGWENEKRVITVVGPETGVLNAASVMDTHKVIFLSHSSKENMVKHWINTTAFEPDDCPCFPCHKMHFGFETCNRDIRTGGALCAANIHPEGVYNDIVRHLG